MTLLRTVRVLALLVGLVLFAYTLGRLRTFYYFHAFGIGLDVIEPGRLDLLADSWFVVQNLLFFALISWVAIRTRLVWVCALAVAHGLLPLAAHYAFAFEGRSAAEFLIHYRHSLLKALPFVVLALVWLVYPSRRQALRSLSWPYGSMALGVYILVLGCWGISTAKHFGSYDANAALRWPERYLTQVSLDVGPNEESPASAGPFYLLHTGPRSVALWDHAGFTYGVPGEVRFRLVPRAAIRGLEGRRTFQIQPGSQFL